MKIGFTWRIIPETLLTLEEDFNRLRNMGFNICNCGIRLPETYNNGDGEKFIKILCRTGMELGAIWCGLGDPTIYDLVDGPRTVGLVPEAYREKRLKILEDCAVFCEKHGINRMITHIGFTPENADDPAYPGVVDAIRRTGEIAARHHCDFLMETGEETPITLLRLIEDVDMENVAVNLDIGNLIMYGRGEPLGAIDVLGKHIRGVDAKDATYAVHGRDMGLEKTLGEGIVDFTQIIGKLMDIGYKGDMMIEREIFGEEKIKALLVSREILHNAIAESLHKKKTAK
jgi:L-ribulose-5-phosphate 3-epimerase